MLKFLLPIALIIVGVGCGTATTKEDNQTPQADTSEIALIDSIMESLPGENVSHTIEIKSEDGLMISGKVFEADKDYPWILLCHQAGYNLHEYDEIAPKLNEMGFNCIAIDQRSGGELKGFSNRTFDRATQKGLPTEYVDAEQDIIASLNFMANLYQQPIILWGSSYSSALALHIALENENVKAVISFSPGDYFGSKKPLLKTVVPELNVPFFITASKSEGEEMDFFSEDMIFDETHVHFIPEKEGKHGSKALWEEHEDNEEYWNAINDFLLSFKG